LVLQPVEDDKIGYINLEQHPLTDSKDIGKEIVSDKVVDPNIEKYIFENSEAKKPILDG
jgi:hypothetical protein